MYGIWGCEVQAADKWSVLRAVDRHVLKRKNARASVPLSWIGELWSI